MTSGRQSTDRLLIVDDNEALSQLLAWEFESLGYLVWRAAGCEQAIAAARAQSFDYALIDFHLPDGDGRMLSRWVWRISPWMRMVMMSADRVAATGGGPHPLRMAFVEKPVPPARIHRLFGGRPVTRNAAAGQPSGALRSTRQSQGLL